MPESESHSHTQRIEAFSDGVFAIAITLLIIEIGVPDVHGGGDLADELFDLWPEYAAYVLSFVSIGIYWVNHHAFFRLFHATDHVFLLSNMLFLMAIAFLPFPTAVLGEYLKDSDQRQAAVTLYSLGLLLPAVGWFLVWTLGYWRGLLEETLHPRYLRFATTQYTFSVAIYTVAFALSFVNAWVALGLCAAITLVYLFPPRRPVYVTSRESGTASG